MKGIVVAGLVFSYAVCFGQETVKEFYSEQGKITDEANSLYYRTGAKGDSVFTYFTKSDKLRSSETTDERGVRQNSYTEYYEDGTLRERSSFKDGRKLDLDEEFYPDGKQRYAYKFVDGNVFDDDYGQFEIVHYWDSTGNQIVKDGQGFCHCYFRWGGDFYAEDGEVLNGRRHGKWKGFNGSELAYDEEYDQGTLKKGTRYFDKKEIVYHENGEAARYPGGLPSLAKFLQQNLNYPMEARRKGMQGTVYVSFVIRKNGKPYELDVVIDDMPRPLTTEALRVVGIMDQWIPGKVKGLPVNSRFVLPIKFKLED